MKDYFGERRTDKPMAIVVVGQASESEDDDDDADVAVDEVKEVVTMKKGESQHYQQKDFDHNHQRTSTISSSTSSVANIIETIGKNVEAQKQVTNSKSSLATTVPCSSNSKSNNKIIDQVENGDAGGSTNLQKIQHQHNQQQTASSASSLFNATATTIFDREKQKQQGLSISLILDFFLVLLRNTNLFSSCSLFKLIKFFVIAILEIN